MSNAPLPPDVRRLLAERRAARDARDWARADALRDELASLGWAVEDAASGSTARPILPAAPPESTPAELASRLEETATVDVSLQVVAEDHAEDFARFLDGLARHAPAVTWELVVVANAPTFDLEDVLASAALPVAPEVVRVHGRLGWAESRTLGLRRSLGEITVMLDTSAEPIGDFVAPLVAAFDDPAVGIAGGWGVTSEDGRHFEEAPPGEVDAIEAYCLAIRRDALRSVGGFDPRFRWYRNADLDLSFAVRDAGWRAVRTEPLPLALHEHRGYAALPDAERERLSRRNFYRFLDHWGTRSDLLTRGRG
jgi:hypothetical protein